MAEAVERECRAAPQRGVRQVLPGPQHLLAERCGVRIALVVDAEAGQCLGRPHQEGRESFVGLFLQALGSQGRAHGSNGDPCRRGRGLHPPSGPHHPGLQGRQRGPVRRSRRRQIPRQACGRNADPQRQRSHRRVRRDRCRHARPAVRQARRQPGVLLASRRPHQHAETRDLRGVGRNITRPSSTNSRIRPVIPTG